MKLLLLLLLGFVALSAQANTAVPAAAHTPLGRSGEHASDQDDVADGEEQSMESSGAVEVQPGRNATSIHLRWAAGGYCAIKKRTGWFCDGATRVYCCRRAVLWQLVWGACETWPNWFSCKGGGYSAAARLGTSSVAQAQHVEDLNASSTTVAPLEVEQKLTTSGGDDLAGNDDNESTTALVEEEQAGNLTEENPENEEEKGAQNAGNASTATLSEDAVEVGAIAANAESRWVGGSFCASKKRGGWFCWGTTRVKCCKRGLLWTSCQSIAYWSGCRWRSNAPEMQEEAEQGGNVTGESPENEEEAQNEENVSTAALTDNGAIAANAESRWVGGSFCASKKRGGWFCWGTTRVKCCKRGLLWTSCQSIAYWSGCRWRSNAPEMQEEEEQMGNVTAAEESPEIDEDEGNNEEDRSFMESPESSNNDTVFANVTESQASVAASRSSTSNSSGVSASSFGSYAHFCMIKKKRAWFCFGTTRVQCCAQGLAWTSCGSMKNWSGCRLRRLEAEEEEVETKAEALEVGGQEIQEAESLSPEDVTPAMHV